jgi:hypothetical protein
LEDPKDPKERKGLSDSPFKCKQRKDDICSAGQVCPVEEFKGKCCLFCTKKWTCPMTCMKVMSYLAYERSNPSKFTPQEKKAVKHIEWKGDVREIGNPSTRKTSIEEDIKCPTCAIRLTKVESTDPNTKVTKKGLKCDKCGYYQEETQAQPQP